MDRRKVEQWLAIQRRKGGPALAVLEQWIEELQPRLMEPRLLHTGWVDEFWGDFVLKERLPSKRTPLLSVTWMPLCEQVPEKGPRTYKEGGHRLLQKQPRRPKK